MSGRPCAICSHARRAEIEAEIIATGSFRNIARRYGMSAPSVLRHRNGHMAEQLAAAAEARRTDAETEASTAPASPPASPEPSRRRDAAEALDIVGQLQAINGATLRVLADARASGDGRLVLLAVDRVQKQIELQAKLLGELDDRPVVNLLLAPEWLLVRSTLLDTLRPYPDARYAVSAALVALEGA